MAAEWDKAASLRELDITATDLATNVIQDILTRYWWRTFASFFVFEKQTRKDKLIVFTLGQTNKVSTSEFPA